MYYIILDIIKSMDILFSKKITCSFFFFFQLVYRNMKLKCADFSRIVMENDKRKDIPEMQPIFDCVMFHYFISLKYFLRIYIMHEYFIFI